MSNEQKIDELCMGDENVKTVLKEGVSRLATQMANPQRNPSRSVVADNQDLIKGMLGSLAGVWLKDDPEKLDIFNEALANYQHPINIE